MRNMLILIILLSVFFEQNSWSQTILRWYPSTTRFPEGECLRVHTPSDGDSYLEKLKPDECRPEKTNYLWKDPACYEVDAESGGKAFGLKLKTPHACAPEGALLSFLPGKRECYLVDPSGGLKFKAKVDVRECQPAETEIDKKFFPAASGIGGECLEVHRTEGRSRWEKRLDPTACRGGETRFVWRKTREFQGECWEVAGTGPEAFNQKVASTRCRPENVSYVFQRTAEKKGDCYEVDKVNGDVAWSQKVDAGLCRPTDETSLPNPDHQNQNSQ